MLVSLPSKILTSCISSPTLLWGSLFPNVALRLDVWYFLICISTLFQFLVLRNAFTPVTLWRLVRRNSYLAFIHHDRKRRFKCQYIFVLSFWMPKKLCLFITDLFIRQNLMYPRLASYSLFSENDFELLVFLFPFFKFWDYSYTLLWLILFSISSGYELVLNFPWILEMVPSLSFLIKATKG